MAHSAQQTFGDTEALVDRFWTVSNGFSLLRVVLAPIAVWLIWLGSAYVWETTGVVMLMIVSDMLDGYLARRRDEVTRWGKILDPLADKVAIGAITLVMAFAKDMPVWVVVVVLGRDVLIVLGGMILAGRRHVVVSSNIWGKLTTLTMSALLLAFLWDVDVLKPFLLWTGACLLFVSLISYGRHFAKLLGET